MGRNQQSNVGGYAGNKGNKPYASEGKGGGGKKKTVDAATALGLDAEHNASAEHNAFGHGWTGNGAAGSSGLALQIDGNEHYDRIGLL